MWWLIVSAALAQDAEVSPPPPPPPPPLPSYVLPAGPEGALAEARLASLLSAYIQIDTQMPHGPDSFAMAGDRPEWVDFLVRNWAEPLGLEWSMVSTNFVMRVPSADERPPIIWLSHADVVPVDARDVDDWSHPPFDGVIADGMVYGRGVLDNKGSTVMQLEAIRALLESGGEPSRDILVVVTPDEEQVSSDNGAARLVRDDLAALGSPTTVLDEGGYILPDFFEGQIVATVAVAEKVYVTVELHVKGEGGHASMPREGNPTAVLSTALGRIAAWETKRTLTPEMQESLKRIGAAESFPLSMVLKHPRLFKPVLLGTLGSSPAGNAVTRDTVAITILDAGVKDNVIPGEAVATLNARLLPGKPADEFLGELREVIDDDRVEIVLQDDPVMAQASAYETETFRAIAGVLEENVPGVIVIPNVNPGTQDSRFFSAAGLECYRFIPVVVDTAGRSSIHGNDEKLETAELLRGATLYQKLLTAL